MNDVYYLIGGVILGAGIVYAVMRHRQTDFSNISEQFLGLAKERLGAEKEVIRTDLEGKKDAIKTLVDEIRKQLKDTDDKLRQSDKERVNSFSTLKAELENQRQLTHELRGSAEDLKRDIGDVGARITDQIERARAGRSVPGRVLHVIRD